jgi:mannose-6-phosphate isomerase-like protein (cupin superfamily)
VLSDADAGEYAFASIPGMVSTPLWATTGAGSFDQKGADPIPGLGTSEDLPGPGETRFFRVQFPPDAVFADPAFDPDAAAAEQRRQSPRLAAQMNPAAPGMHSTPTVDYSIVLDGPIWMELDGGEIHELATGDVVIQNGTRHAWRNHRDVPATMLFVWVGRPA